MEKRNFEDKIKNITWLMDRAGKLDWAHNKNGLIAFDSRGHDGYHDVYVANPDGTGKRRLTYFNDPAHPHYKGGRAIVADGDWNHMGDTYAALVNILIILTEVLQGMRENSDFKKREIFSITCSSCQCPILSF